MNILILCIGCILSSFLFLTPLNEVTAQNLPDFNFIAVGDWSCDKHPTTISGVTEKNPEVVLALGDFSYRDTADCWLELIEPINDKVKVAIGNHDTENLTLINQYKEHFNLENVYYSFNFQNVHFVAISTEPHEICGEKFEMKGSGFVQCFDKKANYDTNQYAFVDSDLQAASSNPDIDWIVVFYHKLAYTSPNNVLEPIPEFRDPYHQIFEKYGVDLILQGHLHAYERSYPIKINLEDTQNPIITDYSTNNYLDPEGQIFATVSTGGAHLHNFMGQKEPYMASQYLGWGFLNIDIINEGKILIAKFYSNDGTVLDQFGVAK